MVEKSENLYVNGHESVWLNYGELKPDQTIEMDPESIIKEYHNAISAEVFESSKIQKFLEAQKQLEGINFLRVVGHDPQGIMTYLIFGYKYPVRDNQQFKLHIEDMMSFINSRKRKF